MLGKIAVLRWIVLSSTKGSTASTSAAPDMTLPTSGGSKVDREERRRREARRGGGESHWMREIYI